MPCYVIGRKREGEIARIFSRDFGHSRGEDEKSTWIIKKGISIDVLIRHLSGSLAELKSV